MRDHCDIDRRSLALAKAVIEKIELNPQLDGLGRARQVCKRWLSQSPSPALDEWMEILGRSWEEVREVLLADTEDGRRLRQSDPFCGILSPSERWQVYRQWSAHETA